MPITNHPRVRPTGIVPVAEIDPNAVYSVDLKLPVEINGCKMYPVDEHFFRGAVLLKLMQTTPEAVAGSALKPKA